ncbi:GH1 family beta-glucosidase [Oleiharenicola lentus]|uniref:GH1 family beta-glucosidase n=1 Tax=Oleiharenicola lentus TaxID=2508720 RepID=UPI003F67772E
MTFPKDFTWGAATSSYQIEGFPHADGRGASVWDEFCATPGRVHNGDTGAVACEHYTRSAEDVQLMRDLGLRAYRFSVAWPRVMPTGRGPANAAGLAFYDRLVDQLLEAKVEPWLTLFHWDYPLPLYREGGWLHPDSPQWFADYTHAVVDKLSDRVRHWMTLNEPQCFMGLGHQTGIHAPGDKLPLDQALLATQNVLLAHGLAVQVIRSRAKSPPLVGWAPTGEVPTPATETEADIQAARETYWQVPPTSVWNMAWWLDPVLRGHYPEQGLQAYGSAVPRFTEADLRTMHQPLDFLGLNIYHGYSCRRSADGKIEVLKPSAGSPHLHNHWPFHPAALQWGPTFVHERYGLPIVITENGTATHDWVFADGEIHDSSRVDFFSRYLAALRRAMANGVNVKGYFAWSLMDNFEWAEGYRFRFGLVHVDFATQKRTLKDSARWYSECIRSNGEFLPD